MTPGDASDFGQFRFVQKDLQAFTHANEYILLIMMSQRYLRESSLATFRAVITLIAALVALTIRIGAQVPQRDSLAPPVAPLPPSDSVYRPEELRGYLFGTFGPRPVFRSLALAGFDQWRGRPTAFPQNGRGFADRLGTRFAQVAISHTLRFGLSRAFDQRTMRYQPCTCGDSINRFTHALVAPLRVSTPDGPRLSMLNPLTELASGILVTGTRSDGLHVGEGIRNGVTSVAAESVTALLREFWPWHWRPPFL